MPYDMSNRSRQAEETRRRIIAAAAGLFVRDGYAATSIAAIAAAARVAEPTVYATFRGKAGILRAVVSSTLRGGDESVPVSESREWRAMEAEQEPRRQIALFARVHRRICEREAALFAQLEAAAGADSEAAELLAEYEARRYRTQDRLARTLSQRGGLRTGLGTRTAADVIWALASERTYLALVGARGWSPPRYERWLADQLAAALL
jgi:AcrR family transcriptional regulator